MGIDRIGHGASPVPVPDAGGPSKATTVGSAFQVPPPAAAASPAPAHIESAAPATRALERLRSGEIDLGGYVDLKVDEATAHLAALPAGQLESIRGALRERLASDPSLVELLQSATGETLAPRDEHDE